MQPQIPILAQSENKSKFLERLGISDDTEGGKKLYAMMKEEAVAGRARMSENPHSLLPQLINDPTLRPPYSNTHISETAMHRETLYIYQTARPDTKAVYDLGHYVEGGTEENWIIKWLLWHVFRYRDNRNRGRSIPTWIARDGRSSLPSANSSISICESAEQQTTPTASSHLSQSRERQDSGFAFYDPVRDTHRRP